MKYRVERVRTDHGYGAGWVVLDPRGDVMFAAAEWWIALEVAQCASRWVTELTMAFS